MRQPSVPLPCTAAALLDKSRCLVIKLGQMEFGQCWRLQHSLAEARHRQAVPDLLLLVEHSPVYTLGRRAPPEHLLADAALLQRLGASVYRVDRGGEATYHGPGQIIGYPILDIGRVGGPRCYVWALEEALITTLGTFGLRAHRQEGMVGVWVGGMKIAAIGVHVSRRITTHGFALNVQPDLSYFQHIIPCGMPDLPVTSMAQELGRDVRWAEVVPPLLEGLAEVLALELEPSSLDQLVREGLVPGPLAEAGAG